MVKTKPAKRVGSKLTVIDGKPVLVRYYAERRAYAGADTWRQKGGFITVTGGNGIGIVPQAFQRAVYNGR
jgi:hypothetical protein